MGRSNHIETGSATKLGVWPKYTKHVSGQNSRSCICSINSSWNLGKPTNFMMNRNNKCVTGARNIAKNELQWFWTVFVFWAGVGGMGDNSRLSLIAFLSYFGATLGTDGPFWICFNSQNDWERLERDFKQQQPREQMTPAQTPNRANRDPMG